MAKPLYILDVCKRCKTEKTIETDNRDGVCPECSLQNLRDACRKFGEELAMKREQRIIAILKGENG